MKNLVVIFFLSMVCVPSFCQSASMSLDQDTLKLGFDFIETTAALNLKMVYVDGGTFMMGATPEQAPDGAYNEMVIRQIRLDSFYIGECEITQDQWSKIMGTSILQQIDRVGGHAAYGIGPDYPMYYVNWDEAQAFCRKLSQMTGRKYVLPTEAQWEYAARGGQKNDGMKYSGSQSPDDVAWYSANSGKSTHPVRSKNPNELGLYDMSGNVWEWCSDLYSSEYDSRATDNPIGPMIGSNRVIRGGCWESGPERCRVSCRFISNPGYRNSTRGFRVVLLL